MSPAARLFLTVMLAVLAAGITVAVAALAMPLGAVASVVLPVVLLLGALVVRRGA